MRKILYIAWAVYWLASSCNTLRKKTERKEQHRYAYAQSAFTSDSILRHWYFTSDSAFSYHPDSGLHTFSGRLLGWERRVNHSREQHTLDSAGSYQHNANELARDGRKTWKLPFFVVASLLIGIATAGYYGARKLMTILLLWSIV